MDNIQIKIIEQFPERLEYLNTDQKLIVNGRMADYHYRQDLLRKLLDSEDPEINQSISNALRDMVRDTCEHNRPTWNDCFDCQEIDHLLFED